jgi:hypothetical protein
MTQRKSIPKSRPAVWRRKGDEWFLTANGRTYASIFQDYDHFVCFAVCAAGHSYDVGPAIDLTKAKIFLSRRFGP